jgi:hypothetical protein
MKRNPLLDELAAWMDLAEWKRLAARAATHARHEADRRARDLAAEITRRYESAGRQVANDPAHANAAAAEREAKQRATAAAAKAIAAREAAEIASLIRRHAQQATSVAKFRPGEAVRIERNGQAVTVAPFVGVARTGAIYQAVTASGQTVVALEMHGDKNHAHEWRRAESPGAAELEFEKADRAAADAAEKKAAAVETGARINEREARKAEDLPERSAALAEAERETFATIPPARSDDIERNAADDVSRMRAAEAARAERAGVDISAEKIESAADAIQARALVEKARANDATPEQIATLDHSAARLNATHAATWGEEATPDAQRAPERFDGMTEGQTIAIARSEKIYDAARAEAAKLPTAEERADAHSFAWSNFDSARREALAPSHTTPRAVDMTAPGGEALQAKLAAIVDERNNTVAAAFRNGPDMSPAQRARAEIAARDAWRASEERATIARGYGAALSIDASDMRARSTTPPATPEAREVADTQWQAKRGDDIAARAYDQASREPEQGRSVA